MSVPFIILAIVYIALCIGLVVMILLQKKRSAGLGSLGGMGGGGDSGTYWDKNKGRSLEGTLEKYTKIGGVLFFILSLVLTIV